MMFEDYGRSYQFKINFPPHTNSVTKLNSKVTKMQKEEKDHGKSFI